MPSTGLRLLGPALGATLALCAGIAARSDQPKPILERAELAYAAGRCEEVLAAFSELGQRDGPPHVDGVSHYRWGFCAEQLRRGDAADHYRRASELLALQVEAPDAPLEAHFYRVNALLNLQQPDAARSAARVAVDRWRAGQLPIEGQRPEAWFRLGKLLLDAGERVAALEPLGRALDLSEAAGERLRDAYVSVIRHAAGRAGDARLERRAAMFLDSSGLENRLEVTDRTVAAPPAAEAASEARETRAGELAAGPDGGRPIDFGSAVIDRAHALSGPDAPLPVSLDDGRLLTEIEADDLRLAISDQARVLLDLVERSRSEAAADPSAPMLPANLTARLEEADKRFVASLLEALRRGLQIGVWAEDAGYARLIEKAPSAMIRGSAAGPGVSTAGSPASAEPRPPGAEPLPEGSERPEQRGPGAPDASGRR